VYNYPNRAALPGPNRRKKMLKTKKWSKVFLIVSIFVNFLFFPLTVLSQDLPLENGEIKAVKEAVEQLYIKGLRIRDFSLIKAVCIPDARLMGVGPDGNLHVTTLQQWSKKFDPKKPPFKKLDAKIVKVDIAGTASQVRINFLIDGEKKVTDFLNMLKINGQWKITNIIDY
jgi:hypothetical protein